MIWGRNVDQGIGKLVVDVALDYSYINSKRSGQGNYYMDNEGEADEFIFYAPR